MDKEFTELGINKKEIKTTIVKKETKKINTNSYSMVVGTFKYRNSAEKQMLALTKICLALKQIVAAEKLFALKHNYWR